MPIKQDFIGKGLGGEPKVREERRTAFPCGSVSGFTVTGLVARLSLASHSNSGAWLSCLLLHCSAKTDSQVCLIACPPPPLHQKYILTFPSTSLEYFLRAI